MPLSPIISVKNIGKKYKLGATLGGRNYKTLRDVLTQAAFSPFRKLSAAFRKEPSTGGNHSSHNNPITKSPNNPNEFWALKDISFDVQQGEVVGIIGANGAGKSTLLKVLCGITEPTEGEIHITGRIASLLEVGTGFHPELSGRENVYMNGAILGMTKAEIDAKFDEIVAFAEVEKFIDTPVKRYSSGMYVRLAFAVAAHLEPEILLVDEVLAVGDIAFQKKCLGKMEDVSQKGRTVLFVSHNMNAIRQLCKKCLWIHNGRVKTLGPTQSVIDSYIDLMNNSDMTSEAFFKKDPEKEFQVLSVRLLNDKDTLTKNFGCDSQPIIELVCRVNIRLRGLYGYMVISRKDRTTVIESDSFDVGPNPFDNLAVGKYTVRISIPSRTLAPGDYVVYLCFTSELSSKNFIVDKPGVVCSFRMDDYTSRRGNSRNGFFSTLLPWDIQPM